MVFIDAFQALSDYWFFSKTQKKTLAKSTAVQRIDAELARLQSECKKLQEQKKAQLELIAETKRPVRSNKGTLFAARAKLLAKTSQKIGCIQMQIERLLESRAALQSSLKQ